MFSTSLLGVPTVQIGVRPASSAAEFAQPSASLFIGPEFGNSMVLPKSSTPPANSDATGKCPPWQPLPHEPASRSPWGLTPGSVAAIAGRHSQPADGRDSSAVAVTRTDAELQVQLLTGKTAAEENARRRSDFLRNMSHELRTPMNGILGFAELLEDTELQPLQRDCVRKIRTSASDLMTVIDNLLDYSRIESGEFEITSTPFDIREHLTPAIQSLALRAQQKGLDLIYRLSPEVPQELIGDAGRLTQALGHLVGNAIKFTEHGEIVVNVSVVRQSRKTVTLNVQVSDTGTGIAAESVDSIFDAFHQADSSTTRKHGGTGLGLAITRQISELMNGAVRVETCPGQGSTFHFTADFGQTGQRFPQLIHSETLSGLEVLVVDDSRANGELLEELLRRHGMKPTLVSDGEIALQTLERACKAGSPWPVVLLDDRMPQVHGFLIAETILDRPGLAQCLIMMITPGDRRTGQQRVQDLASPLISPAVRERAMRDVTRERTTQQRCQELKLPWVMKPVLESNLISAIARATSQRSRPVRRIPVAPPAKATRRVLVAEDNRINQTIAARILQRHGYEVSVADNGRQAVELASREPFDIVLMDIQMPELDGFEATEQLRRSGNPAISGLPIVALTAHNSERDRERCLAAMDGYVTKPIQPEKLMAELERILEGETATAADGAVQSDRPANSPSTGRGSSSRSQEDNVTPSVLDREALLRRVEGNCSLLQTLVETYETTHQDYLSRIRRAVDAGDPEALKTSAHGLKGAVATLGGIRASAAAQALEENGLDGMNPGDATGQVESLTKELKLLHNALCRLVDERANP